MAKKPVVSIILAAGRGTRMRAPGRAKVCFPVRGVPVILRALDTYEQAGVGAHCLVVGHAAAEVMETVSARPGRHLFCHQPVPLGTGNAARAGAGALSALGYGGDILIAAGDKVIRPEVVRRLLDLFAAGGHDLLFVTGAVADFPDSGRVVRGEDGLPAGIVEVFDIKRHQLLLTLGCITARRPVPATEARHLTLTFFPSEAKAALAFGALWDEIDNGVSLTDEIFRRHFPEGSLELAAGGRRVTPEMLSGASEANLSVYLFRARALYRALERLGRENAQQEEYLTDAVGALAAAGAKIATMPIERPELVMAFNTPEELRLIEESLPPDLPARAAGEPGGPAMLSPRAWLAALDGQRPQPALVRLYGRDFPGLAAKQARLRSLVRRHLSLFGDGPVVISRAPGRVNIMGRHIDHQGGCLNQVSSDRDIYLVAGVREDRQARLEHLEPSDFPPRDFPLEPLLEGYDGNWLDFVNGDRVRARVDKAGGDWSQYIAAAFARLAARYPRKKFRGLDITVTGDIPIASGLSSSSALLVAAVEAIAHFHDCRLPEVEFAELCGEAEWFVGTRGGCGDHAAMKFSRLDSVVQTRFLPLSVGDTVPFPAGCHLLVAASHQKAHKTAGSRGIFNHRVACYHIGREMFKRNYPEFAERVSHLRDINPRTLGVEPAALLEMLKSLPLSLARGEIPSWLPESVTRTYLAGHADDFDAWPIRPVVLYGLAECARSRLVPELLRRGETAELGCLMNISHDGDRVVSHGANGGAWPFEGDSSDALLDRLVAEARRAGPAGTDPFPLITGGYSCSTPEIDGMVDIVRAVPGVLGAQVSGAGLGGCIMVLARSEACPEVEKALEKHYYEPAGLEPAVFACRPGSGSLILQA